MELKLKLMVMYLFYDCYSCLLIALTVLSFVDLVKYVFTNPGVKYFLSERLSQDPLEKFFSCQCQMVQMKTQQYKNSVETPQPFV